MQHPNILVLWTDEQRADSMAAYGNELVATPNLDRLAAQSVLFERCYVSQPVCTPSRSTVLTGLWPHSNGCVANNIALAPETPCLPELLPAGGYETAYMGKWHLGDEISAQHGFDEWVSIEDMYRPYYRNEADRQRPCDYSQWLIDQGFTPNRRDEGYFDRWFASCLPARYSKPAFLAERACAFLERERDRPFCLHVNYLEPHSPINGPYNGRHDPAADEPPANFGPDAYPIPARYRERRESSEQEAGDWERAARTRARYWGLMDLVDESVGRILTALEESGELEQTLIMFTSDHGNCLGSHGIMYKTVMYEESVRVPLLVRLPGGTHAGERIAAPVSHIDLLPTTLDAAGHAVPPGLQGRSLLPLIEGAVHDAGDVFIEWHPVPADLGVDAGNGKHPGDVPERCVVGPDGWKYVWRAGDEPDLLIDLTADPGERCNLADDPGQTARIAAARERIRAWQQRSGDVLQL